MPARGPLSHLRVLDLSRLLPGPWATLVLADLGADVVKIEDPNGGDYLRWMPPQQGEQSALFYALNRGKRSVALDLKDPEDRALFLQLAAKADVVVESFRPGVMDKLGVGFAELQKVNERLVLCSISGFGQTGPYAARAGHDVGYLALAGVLAQLGAADASPAQPNVQFADIAGGGLVAVSGLLAALLERARTGRGRWVDVSMTEGAMSALHMNLAPFLAGIGEPPTRGRGMLSGESPCYALYRTQDDRSLAVGALEPKFWSALCRALQRPDLIDQGLVEGEEADRVRAEVQAVVGTRTLAEWQQALAPFDVCTEPVLEADELAAHPVHAARGTFFEGPHGLAQRTPVRFADGDGAPASTPAPGLGAHRDEVLAQWLSR